MVLMAVRGRLLHLILEKPLVYASSSVYAYPIKIGGTMRNSRSFCT